MTLCSPDAQAFRPPDEKVNVLQVSLPTNFKAARFDSDAHTAFLRELERDIEAARFDSGGRKIELPVKLKVHDSRLRAAGEMGDAAHRQLPLRAKDGVRSIKDAVHARPRRFARGLRLGGRSVRVARRDDATTSCRSRNTRAPRCRCCALLGRARPDRRRADIERIDRLVQAIAAQRGLRNDVVDATISTIDRWLERNRRKVA